jgi:hypothetical protein
MARSHGRTFMRSEGRWLCGVGIFAVAIGCAHTGTVATDRTVGTAAQFDSLGADAAEDGSWVVLSQADEVDGPLRDYPMTMHPLGPSFGLKLFLGDRPGIDIDDHLASPDDRWLLVEREDRFHLVEAATAQWIELASAKVEGIHGDSLGTERPVELSERTDLMLDDPDCFTDFSADGGMLLFLDPGDGHPRLVARRLSDGTRHVIDPGPGVLSWARLMPAGDAVAVGMTVRDGGPAVEPMEWPHLLDELSRCVQPRLVPPGARNVTRVLGLDGQELGRRPGEYLPMGAGLIQRTAEQGFSWWRPDLDRDVMVPACVGYLLSVDPVRGRMLALCDADHRREDRDYFLHGRLRVERFEDREELGTFDIDSAPPRAGEDGRFVALEAPDEPLVVDMDAGRVIALPEGERVVAIAVGRALVQYGSRRRLRKQVMRIGIVDLQSLATLETFWARVSSWQWATGRRSVVVHGRQVVDLWAAKVIGRLPDDPLWVMPDGRALLVDPGTRQPRGRALPRGPLRWFELER